MTDNATGSAYVIARIGRYSYELKLEAAAEEIRAAKDFQVRVIHDQDEDQ